MSTTLRDFQTFWGAVEDSQQGGLNPHTWDDSRKSLEGCYLLTWREQGEGFGKWNLAPLAIVKTAKECGHLVSNCPTGSSTERRTRSDRGRRSQSHEQLWDHWQGPFVLNAWPDHSDELSDGLAAKWRTPGGGPVNYVIDSTLILV